MRELLEAAFGIAAFLIAPLIAPALIIQAIRLKRWPWVMGAVVTSLAYLICVASLWASPDPKSWLLFGDIVWLPVVGLVVSLVAMLQYPVANRRRDPSGSE